MHPSFFFQQGHLLLPLHQFTAPRLEWLFRRNWQRGDSDHKLIVKTRTIVVKTRTIVVLLSSLVSFCWPIWWSITVEDHSARKTMTANEVQTQSTDRRFPQNHLARRTMLANDGRSQLRITRRAKQWQSMARFRFFWQNGRYWTHRIVSSLS